MWIRQKMGSYQSDVVKWTLRRRDVNLTAVNHWLFIPPFCISQIKTAAFTCALRTRRPQASSPAPSTSSMRGAEWIRHTPPRSSSNVTKSSSPGPPQKPKSTCLPPSGSIFLSLPLFAFCLEPEENHQSNPLRSSYRAKTHSRCPETDSPLRVHTTVSSPLISPGLRVSLPPIQRCHKVRSRPVCGVKIHSPTDVRGRAGRKVGRRRGGSNADKKAKSLQVYRKFSLSVRHRSPLLRRCKCRGFESLPDPHASLRGMSTRVRA